MPTVGRYGSSTIVQSATHPTDAFSAPVLNTIRRAVVIEYINDLSFWSSDELLSFYNSINNSSIINFDPSADDPETLRYLIPRNSVLCTIITDGAGRGAAKPSLACPMFSSHLMMPVKAGEQVWIFQEKPQSDFTTLFWMCRIPGPGYVEDVNYTHGDRAIVKEPDATPRFYNGMGSTYTIGENPNAYDIINIASRANLSHCAESVPRLTKRPGDLVMQGSNNTAIILGEDRGWTAEERPDGAEFSNAGKTEEELEKLGCGSIDIVAGRGRFIGDLDEDPSGTANRVVQNTREKEETDKYFSNPVEGDPDLITDASRVYVSMNTNGDTNLGLEYPNINGIETPLVEESPYVILKSDEVRIIARRDSENDINGSIKIVKEGVADSEGGDGRAVIMLQPDGTIVIDGPKIVIGSGIEKSNGAGTQVEIGDGATESIVLGDQLNALLINFLDQFIQSTPLFVMTGVGPGVLDPPLLAAATELKIALESKQNLSKIGKTK